VRSSGTTGSQLGSQNTLAYLGWLVIIRFYWELYYTTKVIIGLWEAFGKPFSTNRLKWI
jgi:hypothetical protein